MTGGSGLDRQAFRRGGDRRQLQALGVGADEEIAGDRAHRSALNSRLYWLRSATGTCTSISAGGSTLSLLLGGSVPSKRSLAVSRRLLVRLARLGVPLPDSPGAWR